MLSSSPQQVFAYQDGKRWQWMVPLFGGLYVSRFTYASKASAMQAGRRSFAKLQRAMAAGDMP